MKVLQLDTSIMGDKSVTRELTAAIVKKLAAGDRVEVTSYDLAAEAPPHLTAAALPNAHPASAMAGALDASAQTTREASERILEEFLAADVLVIGAPMYNFSVPSQLKAWIDRICVPGKTFAYGPNGPHGLAGGKRVIVAVARGGFYGAQSAFASAEHGESYLRAVFGFLGITDIEFILAEGLAVGAESRAKAIAAADEAIGQLAA